MKYFKSSEFSCKCGCGFNNMNQDVLMMLDLARSMAEIPFFINCGCRCVKHNKEVGGVEDSSHLSGLAVDIRVHNDFVRYRIINSLLKVGFERVLIYDSFVHVDLDNSKVHPIIKLMK